MLTRGNLSTMPEPKRLTDRGADMLTVSPYGEAKANPERRQQLHITKASAGGLARCRNEMQLPRVWSLTNNQWQGLPDVQVHCKLRRKLRREPGHIQYGESFCRSCLNCGILQEQYVLHMIMAVPFRCWTKRNSGRHHQIKLPDCGTDTLV